MGLENIDEQFHFPSPHGFPAFAGSGDIRYRKAIRAGRTKGSQFTRAVKYSRCRQGYASGQKIAVAKGDAAGDGNGQALGVGRWAKRGRPLCDQGGRDARPQGLPQMQLDGGRLFNTQTTGGWFCFQSSITIPDW